MTKQAPAPDLPTLRQRLRALHAEIGEALQPLLGREPLFRGYVYLNPRRCGNEGCRCASGELHDAWVIRTPSGRHQIKRTLKEEERGRLLPLAESYRAFRDGRRRLNRLFREAGEIASKIEQARCVDPFSEEGKR